MAHQSYCTWSDRPVNIGRNWYSIHNRCSAGVIQLILNNLCNQCGYFGPVLNKEGRCPLCGCVVVIDG